MSNLSTAALWLVLVGVFAVSGVLVYIAWWALFADRASGRRRCPSCWYDMAYTAGMVCGECGFSARGEWQFAKTRRRYRVALAAIGAGVIIALVVNQRVTQRGLVSYVPTQVLLWLMPLSADTDSSVYNELITRASYNALSDRHWESLIYRCTVGDWGARPVSDAWIDKYGAFTLNWRRQINRSPKLETMLLKLPPRVEASTREVWPENVPITVAVQVRDWWPLAMECRVRAVPRYFSESGQLLAEGGPIILYRSGDDRGLRRPAYSLELPPLDPATRRLSIDLQIDRRAAADEAVPGSQQGYSDWRPIVSHQIDLATRAEGAIAAFAQPVNDASITTIVKRAFAQGAVKWDSEPAVVRFRIEPGQTSAVELNDTAVGATVELMNGDVVARRLKIWWIAGTNGLAGAAMRSYGFEVDFENLELLGRANADDGLWNIRVRGDAQIALRAGKAAKYWAGEFTVPLTLQAGERRPPPKAWWTEADNEEFAR